MSDLNSELELFDSQREIPLNCNARISNYKQLNEHITTDLGIYKDIRIDSYEPSGGQGRLQRLIYYDDIKRKYEVEDAALSIFQKYSAYELAFISIMGEKSNGKSLILDKVLNLSGVKGNHFSVNKNPGIYVWSQPFRKKNMKVFLLDCQGFKPQLLTLNDAKLYTLLLLISNTLIFNQRTKSAVDDLGIFQSLIKNSFQNTRYLGKQLTKNSRIAAKNLYHLYRIPSLATNKDLANYFTDYNFTFLQDAMTPNYKGKDIELIQCSFLTTAVVSQKYVRHIGQIFSSIMATIQPKYLGGVTMNGNIVCKLINHAANLISRQNVLDIDKLFRNIIQELYVSAYNYCVISYSQLLEKQLRDQDPKNYDELLKILGKAADETLLRYHEYNLDSQMHKLYLRKLQQHIDVKQQLILQINLKKTQTLLRNEFKFQHVNNTIEAAKRMEEFTKYKPYLDHGRIQVMKQYAVSLVEDFFKPGRKM